MMMRYLKSLLSDDSGEIITVILVTLGLGSTFIVGGSQAIAAAKNEMDIHRAGTTMIETGEALQQKFETSATLQASVSPERRAELERRWTGMQTFGEKIKTDAAWDTNLKILDVGVDLAVSGGAVPTKTKLAEDAVGDVASMKDLWGDASARADNGEPLAPEMFAFSKEMVAEIDGRESAEDFSVPLRETVAQNKIADMSADVANRNATPGEPAAYGVVRQRMAAAIARSYTGLKKSGSAELYESIEDEDGAYDRFVREQVLATHPRETRDAKPGDVLANDRARSLFEEGKCDTLLVTVMTEEGPIISELRRDAQGRVLVTSLATQETVTMTLDGGEQVEAPEPEVTAPWQGEFEGTARIALSKGAPVMMPMTIQIGPDRTFTATIDYSGSGSEWKVDWMSHLKWTTKISGTVSEDGTLSGKGTRRTVTTAADGNSPDPLKTSITLKGKITGTTIAGTLKPEQWLGQKITFELNR